MYARPLHFGFFALKSAPKIGQNQPLWTSEQAARASLEAERAALGEAEGLELPGPWEAVLDADGDTYYWNTETNETTYTVRLL